MVSLETGEMYGWGKFFYILMWPFGEMISLITDWIANWIAKLGQAFCHHQYVHKHIEFEYSPYVADYYECRKCGRFRLNEPPESLIYKESKEANNESITSN